MTDMGDSHTVTVFGSADPKPGEDEFAMALAVGRQLAELGYVVANGGYGGTMAASAQGAVEAGGRVIGVTCSIWKRRANAFITREIRTSSLTERLAALIELGRCGYVCLPGATGTLLELAAVWEQLFKGLMPHRPLVCVGGFWQPLVDLMARARAASTKHVAVIHQPAELRAHFPPVTVQ